MKVTLQKSSSMLQIAIDGKFANFQEATRLLTGVEKFSDPYGIFHIDKCTFEYREAVRYFKWRDLWFTDDIEKMRDELIDRIRQIREWKANVDNNTITFDVNTITFDIEDL